MNENLFEYSDMLRSPIEAFCCGTGYWEGPVSSHFWNLSMCRKDL